MNIVKKIRASSLVRDTRGANMVEYIIIVGLIAVVAIAGFTTFGTTVKSKIQGQGSAISNIPGQ